MKPGSFTYHAPRTVDEAVALLGSVAANDGRVIAGGQSLVPTMALRLAQPAHLIDINGVSGLDRIEVIDGELVIGACVRHNAFECAVVDGPLGRLLKQVVHHIAHTPIRTRGTFCGSIAHADPASEWCLLAATLGARMRARSVRGERLISEPGFFEGMMATALAPDELLLDTRLPVLRADTRAGFNEFNRRAGDFAIAMAVAVYRLDNGVIVEPRIGVGAVEASPRRIARRLIEAGTSVVTMSWAPDANATWDTHGNNFNKLKDRLLPPFDAAASSLIEELADRGMLERTIVAILGDFGRTPQVNKDAGRDHWNSCYSILLAGGGFRKGLVYGASDRIGSVPASDPVSPGDIIATLYHLLGVDPQLYIEDVLGRPHLLVPKGRVMTELVG